MKTFKKTLSLLLTAVLLFGVVSATAVVSNALPTVEVVGVDSTASYVDYDFGMEYEGVLDAWIGGEDHIFFKISVNNSSRLFTKVVSGTSKLNIDIYKSNGSLVSGSSQNAVSYWNDSGTTNTKTHSCNLTTGSYYIEIYPNDYDVNNAYYTFIAFAEPIIKLSTPAITSISSPSGGAFSVACTSVKDALTYQVQYSTDSTFKNAKTKSSPNPKIKVTGLKKGVYYYVRMRAYSVYNDGLKVFSNWSRAQSVLVKKLTNTVTISTASKKIAYSTLKSKSVSFLVVAQDKADAPFKFYLKSIPEKLQGKISINKTTGKITVKKGTPKGKYVVTVKINAAATKKYNKASATKTIKITIS